MNSKDFAQLILQMVETVSIKAARDQVKAISDIYEVLDGLASGDLTIVEVEADAKSEIEASNG